MADEKELIEKIELVDWICPKIESEVRKGNRHNISSILNIAFDATQRITYSMAVKGELGSSHVFKDTELQYSLMSGIRLDDMEMVQFFLEKGADPRLKNMDGVSPYDYCMEQGLVEYLDLFEKYETPVKEPAS